MIQFLPRKWLFSSKSTVIYAVIYCFVCVAILVTPQIRALDLRFGDMVQLSQKVATTSDVVIVEIDRKTIEKSGSYPIPDQLWLDILDHIHDSKVRKLYLDRRLAIEPLEHHKAVLLETISKFGPETVAISGFNPTSTDPAQGPIPAFKDLVTVVGGNFYPDLDGRFRLLSTTNHPNAIYANPARWLAGDNGVSDVEIDQKIEHRSFKRVSAWDLLDKPKDFLKDKTVLVGASTSVAINGLIYTDDTSLDRITLIALAYQSLSEGTNVKRFSFLPHLAVFLLTGIFAVFLTKALTAIKSRIATRRALSIIARFVHALLGVIVLMNFSNMLMQNFNLHLPLVSLVTAYGTANIIYSLSKLRLLEVLYEMYSGDISADEAWAWRTVSRQQDALLLMGFNGIKRLNKAAAKSQFFDENNPSSNFNREKVQATLAGEKSALLLELLNPTGLQKIECSRPYKHLPLIRLKDVTEEYREKERLQKALYTDLLTGCLNRAGFYSEAEKVTAPYTIIMMDMNGFKAVNDTMGHAAGDELLKIATSRFKNAIDKNAQLGRLGGDEFCVLLPNSGDRDVAQSACRKLERSLNNNVTIGEKEVKISVAAGYAISSIGQDLDAVMDEADQTMYARKLHLKNLCSTPKALSQAAG